ncbi:hypothetical protein B0H14DRAFT_3532564 [Mycena olivaceomarginata]|nr:hypothetical protein B0H14DRAFT_3532564 [Mycena olivaceomarginata]
MNWKRILSRFERPLGCAGLSEEDETDNLELYLDLDLDTDHGDHYVPYVEPESNPLELPPAQPPALPPTSTNALLSAKERNKLKLCTCRNRKRDEAHLASNNPAVKTGN